MMEIDLTEDKNIAGPSRAKKFKRIVHFSDSDSDLEETKFCLDGEDGYELMTAPCQKTSLTNLASEKTRINAENDGQQISDDSDLELLDVSKYFKGDVKRGENDDLNLPSTSKISRMPSKNPQDVVDSSSSDDECFNLKPMDKRQKKIKIEEESDVIARLMEIDDEPLEEIVFLKSEALSGDETEDDSLETTCSARDRSMDPPPENSQSKKISKISLNPTRFQIPKTPFEMARDKFLVSYSSLDQTTKEANSNEKARIQRLMEKCEMLEENFPGHRNSGEILLDFDLKRRQKIVVDQRIVVKLKSHQKEAVRFLYDNCIGSVNDLSKMYQGAGVVLAHCMGLGKTLTTIALIATISRYNQLKTRQILILCPKSTILNWVDEFVRWIGSFFNIKLFYFEGTEDLDKKMVLLENWKRSAICDPSVLLLGYEAFRNLVLLDKSQLAKNKLVQVNLEEYEAKIKKYLIDGTEMIVLDEGHKIKNVDAGISQAVCQVRTAKRIILTGTPVQNNLKEYYAMINFIKPRFLGSTDEFNGVFANPIRDGQYKDSTSDQVRAMKQRSYILYSTLDPFTHRKNVSVLRQFLPIKTDYSIYIGLTDLQTQLYKKYLVEHPLDLKEGAKQLFTDWTALRKVWTHVRVLEVSLKRQIEVLTKKVKQKHQRKQYRQELDMSEEESEAEVPGKSAEEKLRNLTNNGNWWKDLTSPDDFLSLMDSKKFLVLFDIMKLCQQNREKLVVFSSFVTVLETVEYFLDQITNQESNPNAEKYGFSRYKAQWVKGKDYIRMDGSSSKSMRHDMIRAFNDTTNKRLRLFLISTRAGGVGINLTGAARVILLDVSWNPSTDQQAIFRIYRLGQDRNCIIYRLISFGTMEETIYSRAVTKEAMAFRVVDKKQIDRKYSMAQLQELYELKEPDPSLLLPHEVPEDNLFKTLLARNQDSILRYHTHDAMLDNTEEDELTEREMAEAWKKLNETIVEASTSGTINNNNNNNDHSAGSLVLVNPTSMPDYSRNLDNLTDGYDSSDDENDLATNSGLTSKVDLAFTKKNEVVKENIVDNVADSKPILGKNKKSVVDVKSEVVDLSGIGENLSRSNIYFKKSEIIEID